VFVSERIFFGGNPETRSGDASSGSDALTPTPEATLLASLTARRKKIHIGSIIRKPASVKL
jgi:hypothetical protein